MTHDLAISFATRLMAHASSEKYPTRSVEYMLAWMTLVWSGKVFVDPHVLLGSQYTSLLTVAPPAAWAVVGMSVSVVRLVALILNGGYEPSPMLRLIGSAMGLIWWMSLFYLYTISVNAGADDFPMRPVFLVFVFFEVYSCFRCGQDHAAMKLKRAGTSKDGHG